MTSGAVAYAADYTLETVSEVDQLSCSHALDLVQSGSVLSGSGSFTCSDGRRGSLTVESLRIGDGFLNVSLDMKADSADACRYRGNLCGAR